MKETEESTRVPGVPARGIFEPWEEKKMFDLGGTFQTFVDSLFGFLNDFLMAIFGGLSSFFTGLTIF